jgi:thymidylate synthase (FAD)
MDKIKVNIINKPEICDERLISSLTKLTFSKKLANSEDIRDQLIDIDNSTTTIAENILKFNHSTICEHLTLTFCLQNISRSTQLQIVRHRMASYLASSTHYIDYSTALDNPLDYFVVPFEILKGSDEQKELYCNSCINSIKNYCELIKLGTKCEVARELLPNSFRSSLIITINLRSLKNFLNLRLCGVNTSEINYIAFLMYKEFNKLFPTISNYFVPDCVNLCDNKCKQGKRIENCVYKCWSLEKMQERFNFN